MSALRDANRQLTLADLKGRPVLLNVWATWCAACRAEHAFLMELARRGEVDYLWGLNYKDEQYTPPSRGWGSWVIPYQGKHLRSAKGTLALDLGVYGAPETFVLNASGVITYKHIGPLTPEVWREQVTPHLSDN